MPSLIIKSWLSSYWLYDAHRQTENLYQILICLWYTIEYTVKRIQYVNDQRHEKNHSSHNSQEENMKKKSNEIAQHVLK